MATKKTQKLAAERIFGLRELREAAGLTRKALARRAGLSECCISLLETGKRRAPTPATLTALADALGVSVDALLGRVAPTTRAAVPADGGSVE